MPVAYVKTVIGVCDAAVCTHVMSPRVSRKVIHIAAGCWIVSWPWFAVDHWTWTLNVVVPVVYSVQLVIKGAIVKDPTDPDVRTMTRSGRPSELLKGPLFFTLLMTTIGLFFFGSQVGVVIMACLGFGDGVAPLVGHYIPLNSYYPTIPFGTRDRKTLTGSLPFFLASLVGYHLLAFVICDGSRPFEGDEENSAVAKIAVAAALAEGLSGPYDNPLIALVAALAYGALMLTR